MADNVRRATEIIDAILKRDADVPHSTLTGALDAKVREELFYAWMLLSNESDGHPKVAPRYLGRG